MFQELFIAIENFDMETIRRFTRYGYMAMLSKNSDGFTPLLFAILKFDENVSSVLYEKTSNENQIAAITNLTEKTKAVLSILLQFGGTADYELSDGCTSLGLLKYYYYLEMLSFLPIAMDGKAEEKKEVMKTVIQMFDDITSVLVESGANENRKNKFGETPSEYADRIMMGGIEKRL